MKINPRLMKRLREERSWSQEHLASAAGLSLRTIQRIEAEGNASAESRLAIAAALDVDVTRLCMESPDPAPAPTPVPDEKSRPPFWLRELLPNVLLYVAVSGLLLVLDVRRNDIITWSKWPVICWGAGLVLKWLLKSLLGDRFGK